MTESVTLRLNAHLEAAGAMLTQLATLAATQPGTALSRLPLLDVPIQVEGLVEEWRQLFVRAMDAQRIELLRPWLGEEWHQLVVRAGARIDRWTAGYRDLARAMQRTSGMPTVLHGYAVAETTRRRLLPFPAAGRPRMTPEAGLFLVALHNLFWLARNHATLPREADEDPVPAAAADLVLAPLQSIAKAENLDVGDVMLITELSRWAADLLSGTHGQTSTVPFGLIGGDKGSASVAPGAAARDNAEAWLAAAVAAFRPEFAAQGYELPDVAVFARRPQRRRRLAWRRPLGTAQWQGGGTAPVEILVDPKISDPVDVLSVLKHELLHASLFAADPNHWHGRLFREAALALGMQPKRSTPWTNEGRADAIEIAERLGPYPAPSVAEQAPWERVLGWIYKWPRRGRAPTADTGLKSDLLPVPEALEPSLLALRTLSPIARIEATAEGIAAFSGWEGLWPGLRPLLEKPDALTVRQELVSRLGLRLAAPSLSEERLAAMLDILVTLDALPRLHREPWFDFVASLLAATLGAADHDADAADWQRWAQEAGGHRSLAYWTGRVARAAEELAATREEHDYPKLVWRWRSLARNAVVPWLDARGFPALCLSHWLEGLLALGDSAPRLIISRRVCGFGLADIVDLWQRSGEADAELPLALDTGTATALQEALAGSRRRLQALPAMQRLIRETRHFDIGPRAVAPPAAERPKLADILRYATAVAPASAGGRPTAGHSAASGPAMLGKILDAIDRAPAAGAAVTPAKPSGVSGTQANSSLLRRRRRLGAPDPRQT